MSYGLYVVLEYTLDNYNTIDDLDSSNHRIQIKKF